MGKMKLLAGVLGFAAAFAANAATVDLAKVNGRTITTQDLQSALGGLNEGQREGVLRDMNSRREILSNLIDQEVLVQEGEKSKLDQDAEYKEAVNAFRRQYLASKLLQKNLASKLTESGAKKYYDLHKSEYSTDQVHAQHILVADEAQAREVLKKAKEPKADFQEMAEKMSKDPSAKNNRGDLGVIGRDAPFVKEFKEAAFNAKEGEIVGPVKTSYGYHVIKVVKKKSGKTLEFSDVEMRVKNDMRQELVENYVGNLKKQAKISVDQKALEKM